MGILKKLFKTYWPFARIVIQNIMAYRINLFMSLLGGLFKTLVIYYLWKAIFANAPVPSLAGFTLRDMIIYVFISDITARVVNSDIDTIVSDEVRRGSIAMNLIRPIDYHIRLLFTDLGRVIYQSVTVAAPLWFGLVIVRYLTVKEAFPDLVTLSLYGCSVVCSFLISFLISFCFGLLAFFTIGAWGLRYLKYASLRFFSGEVIPLAFFPLWFRKILSFTPFGALNYTPVMIYLKKISIIQVWNAIAVQIIWVFVLFIFSRWLWERVIKRLSILGG